MRRLTFLLCLVLFTSTILAQELAPQVELFFITENAPTTPIINCTLTAQSQCWGNTSGHYPPGNGDYFMTDSYDEETYTPLFNNMGQASAGFDFVTSINSGYPVFAYGIYKVTSNGTDKYFYIDYRDYRAGFYEYFNPPFQGPQLDIWIKYIYNDKFYYDTYGYHNFVAISNGQLLNIWDLKQKGQQLTDFSQITGKTALQ